VDQTKSIVAAVNRVEQLIELPARQKDKGYVRPPLGDQTFVPEKY